MKRAVRTQVFETNSSSVHSLTLQTEEEFNNSYFWRDYTMISYELIRNYYSELNDFEFEKLFKDLLMNDEELDEFGEYDFHLSDEDDYYERIFPANWVIKNYIDADIKVKNKNSMVAISIYLYE